MEGCYKLIRFWTGSRIKLYLDREEFRKKYNERQRQRERDKGTERKRERQREVGKGNRWRDGEKDREKGGGGVEMDGEIKRKVQRENMDVCGTQSLRHSCIEFLCPRCSMRKIIEQINYGLLFGLITVY